MVMLSLKQLLKSIGDSTRTIVNVVVYELDQV